jgi:hypothetical protein
VSINQAKDRLSKGRVDWTGLWLVALAASFFGACSRVSPTAPAESEPLANFESRPTSQPRLASEGRPQGSEGDQPANAVAPVTETRMEPPQDSDYDGRTDAQERADGTDPNDPDSVQPVRLGYWRFNTGEGRDPWLSETGAAPLYRIGVATAPSFDGQALLITNPAALLRYRDVETNGQANINCRQGGIRLMFKPHWTSANAGGSGPGDWARLVHVGQLKSTTPFLGAFAVVFDPKGDLLWISTQDGTTNQFSYGGHVSLRSNQWYQIVVSYSPTLTRMWVDGKSIASVANGPKFPPPPEARAKGLAIGSDLNNAQQARGCIDEVETFNYPLGAVDVFMASAALSAEVQSAPPAITLRWRNWPTNALSVQRRAAGESDWSTLASDLTAWSWRDTNVTLGRRYEYRVGDRYLLSAIEAPPVFERGKVLLLVDRTVAQPLADELEQFQSDLVGDGWSVARAEVERQDDRDWAATAEAVRRIKARIVEAYRAASNDLQAVLLVGHVPIPYSGHLAPDGHGYRAWPADVFYGDVDGRWTDTNNFINTGGFNEPRHQNRPSDGKFDQNAVPPNADGLARLELAVGRVDFADLPVFEGAAHLGRPRNAEQTEHALLRLYFRKNHRYRHREFTLPERCLVTDTTGWGSDLIYAMALASAGRCFGWQAGRMLEGDLFVHPGGALWGLQFGRAGSNSISDGRHQSDQFADPQREPRVAFALLDGSYLGDFAYRNNFLRAFLGTPNYGLAALWGRWLPWRLEQLALGEWLGTALRRAVNEPRLPRTSTPYNAYAAILGDPTLRLFVVAPPAKLNAEARDGRVRLSWQAAPDPGARYVVLRSTAGQQGRFEVLGSGPSAETEFIDSAPPAGPKLYQVRALRRVTSASGSFTNTSQGIFATAE